MERLNRIKDKAREPKNELIRKVIPESDQKTRNKTISKKKTKGAKRDREPLKVKSEAIVKAEDLAKALGGKQNGNGWEARCPAHSDHNPSLSINEGEDGKILMYCHAGCEYDDIVDAIRAKGIRYWGTRLHLDLPPGIYDNWHGVPYQIHYPYPNEHGRILGYTVRYQRSRDSSKHIIPFFIKDGEEFSPGLPDKNKQDNSRPLFNLPAITKASPNTPIYICEGEKAVNALIELGFLATTPIGGVQAPKKTNWEPLSGRTIIIWPDNDRAGIEFASNVLHELNLIGESDPDISIVCIDQIDPPLREKDDAFDLVERPSATAESIRSLPMKPFRNVNDLDAIIYDEGAVHKAISDAENLLLKVDPHSLFNQNGRMVRIEKAETSSFNGIRSLSMGLKTVDSHYLLNHLNRRVTFLAPRGNDKYQQIDPPAKIANRYLSLSGEWKLPNLTGLIHAPTILTDGTILDRPGYHKQTGLYYDPCGTNFEPVPQKATKEDASKALEKYRHMLKTGMIWKHSLNNGLLKSRQIPMTNS